MVEQNGNRPREDASSPISAAGVLVPPTEINITFELLFEIIGKKEVAVLQLGKLLVEAQARIAELEAAEHATASRD